MKTQHAFRQPGVLPDHQPIVRASSVGAMMAGISTEVAVPESLLGKYALLLPLDFLPYRPFIGHGQLLSQRAELRVGNGVFQLQKLVELRKRGYGGILQLLPLRQTQLFVFKQAAKQPRELKSV
jgi:hypothetical protein